MWSQHLLSRSLFTLQYVFFQQFCKLVLLPHYMRELGWEVKSFSRASPLLMQLDLLVPFVGSLWLGGLLALRCPVLGASALCSAGDLGSSGMRVDRVTLLYAAAAKCHQFSV